MAKRLNKKFVIGLSVVGAVAVAGAITAARLIHHSADYCIAEAEKDLARGDTAGAEEMYGRAIDKDRSNRETYIKLGDLYNRMVVKDPAYLQKAQGMWRGSLQQDPNYKPALDRLLDLFVQETHTSNDPALFGELRNVAERASRADPNNERAASYLHIATLQQWLYNAAYNDKKIQENIDALIALIGKTPSDANAGFFASEAQLKQARILKPTEPAKASKLYDAVAARHEGLIKLLPQDSGVQLRAFQVFGGLAEMDDRADHKAHYKDLEKQAITAAVASAKPSDETYDELQPIYASWLTAQGKPRAEVEKVYRNWVKAAPVDPIARIFLAEFLGASPAQRDEAIESLSAGVPADPNRVGFAVLKARMYERASLIDLNAFRLEDARAASGEKRKSLIAQIDNDLPRIAAMGSGDDFALLKLRGKLEMLQGKPVDAIKTFERAGTVLGNRYDADFAQNLEQAYLATGQTGSAAKVLEGLVARFPDSVQARIALTQLYLTGSQTKLASQQITKLKEQTSDKPEFAVQVTRLNILLLNQQGQQDQARNLLPELPEKTRVEQLSKAQLAALTGDEAQAERLLTLVLHDAPADPDAVRGLVELYLHQSKQPQARQVVADALKAKPGDRALTALDERLAVKTPEGLLKFRRDMIAKITDPFTRDLRSAELAMDLREFDDAARQLDAADGIRPNDSQASADRYQWYFRQGKIEEAAAFVDRAARANIDHMDGLALRARFALDRHDVPDALRWAGDLAGKHEQFAESWLLLGEAQQAAGRFAEAQVSYDAALKRQPNNLDALRFKAMSLESLGQYADEKAVVDTAARIAPDNPVIRDLMLNYELHHGDPEKVVGICQEMLKQDPTNSNLYSALGQACEATARTKYASDTAKSAEFMARAKDMLGQGMTKFGTSPDGRKFYPPLARVLEELGDRAGAEKLLKELAARPDEKDDAEPSRELAQFYERSNRAPEAEQAWRDAYAKSGKSIEAELDLSSFLIRQRRLDEALKVLDANASNSRIMDRRIEVLLSAGHADDARKLVDQLLAANANDPTALSYRGLIELSQGDIDGAIRDYSALRDKDPSNPQMRLRLAQALVARGRHDDAIAELEAALQLAPLRGDLRGALLTAYASAPIPRWDDFERVVQEAQSNPALNSDPTWTALYANTLARRGLYDRALEQIRAARKLDPKSYPLRRDYVNILGQSGNWQAVLQETDNELAEGLKDVAIYQQGAAAKVKLGDKDGAVQEYDAGLAAMDAAHDSNGTADLLRSMGHIVSPDLALQRLQKLPSTPGHVMLAIELYALKGDLQGQIKSATTALAFGDKLTPAQRLAALRSRADALLTLGKPKEARPDYEEVLKLNPDDIGTLNNFAYMLAVDLRSPQDAKQYSGRAYSLAQPKGGIPDVSDTHAWILTLCGGKDAVKGLEILQKLALDPQTSRMTKARYHFAEALVRQGRYDDAKREVAVVQSQIAQMQQNHQPVDNELQAGVQQVLDEIKSKAAPKSQASSQ